jgi:hypothetical protein
METKKDVSYLGKDFGQFKRNLLDFAKQYFPTTYADFDEASPGTLFIEMSAYVGDVLSYYADNNLKESLLEQASERGNIYDLAKSLGYKPLNVVPAYTKLDVFQIIPATGSGASVQPDWRYATIIKPGMRIKQTGGTAVFRTLDTVDFGFSSSFEATEVTVYESDAATLSPTYYLLKKQVDAVSGDVKTATFSFSAPVPYDKIVLAESNVIEIVSVTESDGDAWQETPFLAQDTVFETVPNLLENDPELSPYRASAPSLLKLKRTAKRFITRLRSDNRLELQFGAGISSNNDEEIVPNPTNVGNGLAALRRGVDIDIDPSNFLYTRTYGQAPANTTLTVTYTVGNGIADNVPVGVLTQVDFIDFDSNINEVANSGLKNFVRNSIAVTNPNPATGAKTADTLQDIKNNALANFATQNRLVTREDYIVRAYSMPAKYGSVAKAYIVPDDQIAQESYQDKRIPNPLAMNLYVLGMNQFGQLTQVNQAVKENLKTYLDYYRMVTDAINIKDGFIINVGVNFEITVLSKYNSNEVLLNCINALKTYFDVNRWQINQPIVKSDVTNTLGKIKGVQSVINVGFVNLYDTDFGYSGNVYDLNTATKNGIVYPSLDPSIFEVKYLDKDIKGRVVNF